MYYTVAADDSGLGARNALLNPYPNERQRRLVAGAEARFLGQTGQYPGLGTALKRLVDPATRGDPMSPLRWSSKSTAKLAAELCRQGYTIGARTVADMLKIQDYRALRRFAPIRSASDRND